MRHRTLSLLLACATLLAALPAAAEVYTIKLSNGTFFESRYQPVQAAWDPNMVTFLDETGLAIALPQSVITDVAAQSETKGFGKVINTSTVDLGFAPNDIDQNAQRMAQEASSNPFAERMNQQQYDQKQFVEPSAVGGGIPVGFGGGGGGGFNGAAVPFSAPSASAPSGFAPQAQSAPAPAPAAAAPPAEKPPQ